MFDTVHFYYLDNWFICVMRVALAEYAMEIVKQMRFYNAVSPTTSANVYIAVVCEDSVHASIYHLIQSEISSLS